MFKSIELSSGRNDAYVIAEAKAYENEIKAFLGVVSPSESCPQHTPNLRTFLFILPSASLQLW
jgi:hypothetical protein